MKRWEKYGCMLPHLYKRWNITGTDPLEEEPNTILGNGWDGLLEHVLHEMSHAEVLGIKIGRRLSKRVGQKIGTLPKPDQDMNEAHTWCIEWHTWKLLRMEHFSMGDLHEHAEIQGIEREYINSLLSNPVLDCLFKLRAKQVVKCLKHEYDRWVVQGKPDALPKHLRKM